MTAAERQRRYRYRQRKGKRVLQIEVDENRLWTVLYAAGYLNDTSDADALAAALAEAVNNFYLR